jgi:predicted nucleic acid-binding protein
VVLCDTNIFIHAFNGNQETIDELEIIGFSEIALSAITVMELFQGMGNKAELNRIKKKIKYYDVVQIDAEISKLSIRFIEQFKLSHNLSIPDSIIGASAIVHQVSLYTYNKKDFKFLPGIQLYKSS